MLLFCLILCCNEPFSAKSAIAGFAGARYEAWGQFETQRFRCGASPIEPWGQCIYFSIPGSHWNYFSNPGSHRNYFTNPGFHWNYFSKPGVNSFISRSPGLIGIISRALGLIGIILRTLGFIGIISRTLDLIGTILRTRGFIGILFRTLGSSASFPDLWVSLEYFSSPGSHRNYFTNLGFRAIPKALINNCRAL